MTVLNERVYRRGAEVHRLPLVSLFSASNHLAEDEALGALFDRFLLRCHVDHLDREFMPRLLAAGWALERSIPATTTVSAGDLRALSRRVDEVDLTPVTELYAEMVFKIRDLGVAISYRRAVKMFKRLAASTLLSGRLVANPTDFWVLRYVWDRIEQVDPLAARINRVLDRHGKEADPHPLAVAPATVVAEDLARQLDSIEVEITQIPRSLVALARLHEQIGAIADRTAWVRDDRSREYLRDQIARLLAKIEG